MPPHRAPSPRRPPEGQAGRKRRLGLGFATSLTLLYGWAALAPPEDTPWLPARGPAHSATKWARLPAPDATDTNRDGLRLLAPPAATPPGIPTAFTCLIAPPPQWLRGRSHRPAGPRPAAHLPLEQAPKTGPPA